MKLLQSVAGHSRSLVRLLGQRRSFAVSTEEYRKRNYADNVSEYNTVIGSVTVQRRYFLLRDVYDDMTLDGVQPTMDVFHSLISGAMKGARFQDALFFRDEMKAMGLIPDVTLYNMLISLCGKCNSSEEAVRVLDEMRRYEVKPNSHTYICLLNACAAAGRLDRVYTIVRDMTAAGLGLNKFCYTGLIAAHMNQKPVAADFATKVVEYVERSKEWLSVDASFVTAENMIMGVSEEELYNIPTAEYVYRRGGFLNRDWTVYHVALNACANLRNVEVMETIMDMFKKNGKAPDVYMVMQVMRCYLHSGDIDRGLKAFEEHLNSGGLPAVELYATLVEGAMVGYTPKGMELAQETLVKMNSSGFFLNTKLGSELLLAAAGEKTGGYTTANYIWDLLQARKITPTFPAVEAYYKGLKEREIPDDDPRLLLVYQTCENLGARVGGSGPGRLRFK